MLVNLKMENFKSFMEKAELNLQATGYEILNKTNKTEDGILKGALIVGGNATGKSTVLEAIKFLLELLVWQVNVKIVNYVCLFTKSVGEIQLEYSFVINKEKIDYLIKISADRIYSEKLLINNKERLNRIKENAEYIDAYGKKIEIEKLENNQSAIRRVYFDTKFNEDKTLKLWFEFLEKSVYIDQSEKRIRKATGSASQTTYRDYFEKRGTGKFNQFLENINYDQYVEYTNQYINDRIMFKFENNQKDIIIKRRNMDFGIPLDMESTGTQTLINILPIILGAMYDNAMVVIDEFSSSFHNMLEEKIIKYFMENSENAQMFIVSHSTNLLTNTLLRPDQIYTVDFEKNKGSKLNRVSDSKPREAQNLEKMYLSGVFNGIPNLK